MCLLCSVGIVICVCLNSLQTIIMKKVILSTASLFCDFLFVSGQALMISFFLLADFIIRTVL